jgi:tRNA pseudouridine55 synthase
VDKPEGPTSHDVVAVARRTYRVRRVGHAGTLDPFASGLLPLLLGRGTRLMPYLVGLPKTYEGSIRLGIRTDSDDVTGQVLKTDDSWREVDDARLAGAAAALTGSIAQVPPAYSAKKVGGVPAHRRVRRGEAVTLEARVVDVRRFTVRARDGADFRFEADVGSGTYVRALARDLGEALGCGAHLRALRRTRVGPFRLADAVPFDRLPPTPAPLTAAVPHLPRRALDDAEYAAVRQGRQIGASGEGPDPVALMHGSDLVAVAERQGNVLQPRVVLEG